MSSLQGFQISGLTWSGVHGLTTSMSMQDLSAPLNSCRPKNRRGQPPAFHDVSSAQCVTLHSNMGQTPLSLRTLKGVGPPFLEGPVET